MSVIHVDFTPEQPAARRWWLNPFRFVDDVDLLRHPAAALVFFYDLLVNRPTEFHALVHLFLRACNNLDWARASMTARQTEAVDALIEAVGQGKPPVMYVARKLGVSKQAASQLVQRADKAKMLTLGELFHVYDSSAFIEWTPDEAAIKAQMAKMTRQCAADGTPDCEHTTRGRFALCWPCSQKYGAIREEWLESRNGLPAPTWLLAEARRIDQQLRQDAINALYGQYHAGEIERETRKVRRAS